MTDGGAGRRIDAHVHFWRVARGDYHWMTPDLTRIYRDFGPDDLRPYLARHRIDAVVAVQAAQTVEETDFLLDVAAQTDIVAGVVGWAPFDRPEGPGMIARLAGDPRLKGLRPMIQDIPDDDWMLGPALAPSFAALQAHDLAFDALVFPRHLPNLMRLIERYPDMRVIVDHGAKPRIRDAAFDRWAAGIAAIAKNSAALVKLSGLVTEAGPEWSVEALKPYVAHLFLAFGAERVVFGSDWPVVRLVADYDPWHDAAGALTASLTEAERRAVFGGNAARFYGL